MADNAERDEKEEKKKNPKCTRCRYHKIDVPIRGHKNVCMFKNCECEGCIVVSERRYVSAKQIALSRLSESSQKATAKSALASPPPKIPSPRKTLPPTSGTIVVIRPPNGQGRPTYGYLPNSVMPSSNTITAPISSIKPPQVTHSISVPITAVVPLNNTPKLRSKHPQPQPPPRPATPPEDLIRTSSMSSSGVESNDDDLPLIPEVILGTSKSEESKTPSSASSHDTMSCLSSLQDINELYTELSDFGFPSDREYGSTILLSLLLRENAGNKGLVLRKIKRETVEIGEALFKRTRNSL